MVEYVEAFLFATVLSESGIEGRGGAALAGNVGVAALLLDPVRPAVVLERIGVDGISGHLPTEALVAPPLVSQGFGGDGADMSRYVPPHHSRRTPVGGRCEVCCAVQGRVRYRRQRLGSGSGQWRRVCGVRREA